MFDLLSEYAALIIIMGTVVALAFFGTVCKIAKLIYAPKDATSRRDRKRKGRRPEPVADAHQLDEALERAAMMEQRLRNLEEIMAAQKEEQEA